MQIRQIIIALDQLGNTLLGGWADETISCRAARCRCKYKRWMVASKVINFIFFWQDDHCLLSFISERARRHLPVELRDV